MPTKTRAVNDRAAKSQGVPPLPFSAAGALRYGMTGRHHIYKSERIFLALDQYAVGEGNHSHIHPTAEKIYCVLEGVGEFRHNDEIRTLRVGEWMVNRRGEAHGVRNPGPGNLTIITLATPATLEHEPVAELPGWEQMRERPNLPVTRPADIAPARANKRKRPSSPA